MTGERLDRSESQTTRRSFLKTGAVAASTFGTTALAGCVGSLSGGGSATLKVGVLSTMERDTGKGTLRGAEIAADEINESDDIDQTIEVVSTDTGGTSTGAVDGYNYLVDREEVQLTIGPFSEESASAIMPHIADAQRINLTVGSATPALAQQVAENYEKFKYWFRFAPPNTMFMGANILQFAGEFMVGRQDWGNVGLFYEDAAWTNSLVPFLKEQLPNTGIEVAGEVAFPLNESNFTPYYSELRDMDIDAIFALSALAGIAPVQGYFKAGVDTPLLGDIVPAQSPQFIDDMGGEGDGVVGRTHSTWSAKTTPASQQFIDTWSDRYESRPTKPTLVGLGSYAALKMYGQAVASAGSTDEDAVIPEIEQGEFQLTQKYSVFAKDEEDPVTGQQFTHDLKYGPDLYQSTWSQWQDGEQVTIWPFDLATGEYQSV